MAINRFFRRSVYKMPFPIPLQTWGNQRVKQALHGRIRHRSDHFQQRFAKFADRFEGSIRILRRTGIAPYDATKILVVQMSREWIARLGPQEREETIKILGSSRHKFGVPLENLPGIAQIPKHWPADNVSKRASSVEKRSHHAEVPAPPPAPPQKTRVVI